MWVSILSRYFTVIYVTQFKKIYVNHPKKKSIAGDSYFFSSLSSMP